MDMGGSDGRDKTLPWKQAEAAKEEQRRFRSSQPLQKPDRQFQNNFWGRHTGWSAKPRGESESEEEYWDRLSEEYCEIVEGSDEVEWMFWCLEQDSRREEHGTSQAPCFEEICNVSPVRIHSPVRSVPAARTCRAKGSLQPGQVVPAQHSWCPVCLLSPGYPSAPSQPSASYARAPHLPG
jgi:hypothetical protein